MVSVQGGAAHIALGLHRTPCSAPATPTPSCVRNEEAGEGRHTPFRALVGDELVGQPKTCHGWRKDTVVDGDWQLVAERLQRQNHSRRAVEHGRNIDAILLQLASQVQVHREHEVGSVVDAAADAAQCPVPSRLERFWVLAVQHIVHCAPRPAPARVVSMQSAEQHLVAVVRPMPLGFVPNHALKVGVLRRSPVIATSRCDQLLHTPLRDAQLRCNVRRAPSIGVQRHALRSARNGRAGRHGQQHERPKR